MGVGRAVDLVVACAAEADVPVGRKRRAANKTADPGHRRANQELRPNRAMAHVTCVVHAAVELTEILDDLNAADLERASRRPAIHGRARGFRPDTERAPHGAKLVEFMNG